MVAGSTLAWASLTTAVCCCLLGAFQMINVSNEREMLLQKAVTPAMRKHLFHRLQVALTNNLESHKVPSHSDGVAHSMRSLRKATLRQRTQSKGTSAAISSGLATSKLAGWTGSKHLFNNIKTAMVKRLGLHASQKRHAVLQKKADAVVADVDSDSDSVDVFALAGNETAAEPVKNTVYVYAGREVKPQSTELTAFILQSGFGIDKVGYINSASDADIRSATWDDDCKAIIFPALKDIPDFGANAVKDLKSFVSQGTHTSGTILFLGSPVEVHLINQIFGFELMQDYKEGPYYKDGRYARTSVWAPLPPRLGELGQTESLGFLQSTLPPESRSYYDSFGASVATCTRYDLGRVCYLAQDFSALQSLPQLLEGAAAGDGGAAAEVEELSRVTDSWLGVFQAMLLQSDDDVALQ